MADNVSKKVRSNVMRAIPSRGTRPEVLMRLGFVRSKFKGWRMHSVRLPGKPDFVFPTKKIAVFVDGCFWHGCPIHGTQAKANAEFWHEKIEANKRRDMDTNRKLEENGWLVIRAWEHENPQEVAKRIDKVVMDRRGAP